MILLRWLAGSRLQIQRRRVPDLRLKSEVVYGKRRRRSPCSSYSVVSLLFSLALRSSSRLSTSSETLWACAAACLVAVTHPLGLKRPPSQIGPLRSLRAKLSSCSKRFARFAIHTLIEAPESSLKVCQALGTAPERC